MLPPLEATLAPALPDDVLELDELWSFVCRRKNKRRVWLASKTYLSAEEPTRKSRRDRRVSTRPGRRRYTSHWNEDTTEYPAAWRA